MCIYIYMYMYIYTDIDNHEYVFVPMVLIGVVFCLLFQSAHHDGGEPIRGALACTTSARVDNIL